MRFSILYPSFHFRLKSSHVPNLDASDLSLPPPPAQLRISIAAAGTEDNQQLGQGKAATA